MAQCEAIVSKTGSRCRVAALVGQPLCRFHHPDAVEARKRASAKGGASSSTHLRDTHTLTALHVLRDADASETPTLSDDVLALVLKTMRHVAANECSPEIAKAVAVLATAFVAVKESAIADRLEADLAPSRPTPLPITAP